MKLTIGRRQILGVIGAAALSLTMVVPALAADDSTATVTGGDLTITNPAAGDFSATITGAAQDVTASLATFTVSDLTGSGDGWQVTAQATQFTDDAGTPGDTSDDKALAAGSLEMSQPTVTADGTTSPVPTVNAGPYVIDTADAVTIASAAQGEGMGAYDFSATTLTLSLPADVYAGIYTSTVTISAISAP